MSQEPYERLPPQLRPVRKKQRCKIQLHSDNSQLSSFLFSKLSPELRALVYSFIFPHQTVHISYKECLHKDRWTRIQKVRRNYTPTKRLKHTILKVTSHICLFPYDWERRYALSKQPAAIPKEFYENDAHLSLFRYCPEAINPHHLQHARCVMGARNRGRSWELGVAGEKSDLSLLQVCRRLYHETWFLPFANFTFEFSSYSLGLREDFLSRILYEHQAKAIERVHIHDLMKPADYIGDEGLFSSFPALKHLRLSFIHGLRAEGCEKDWEGLCKAGKLQSVEVIAGHDDDKEQDWRALNRRKAVAAEMLVLGKECWRK
ncbi:hypothetical protein CKM354_000203400 [Cercospora kikuchii]|uniref:Uncharacterized protein n=1 Tax=Cercospora kikuchii TaxID=84275 RepID=A0A9P3C8H1_9PEZI|nr:uncharacterized protein CKM354_000203400 [Cercospora kikuchii]GIZ38622.1 hypothetical protein CKM354_000203400 [Cercospora kikuchii]